MRTRRQDKAVAEAAAVAAAEEEETPSKALAPITSSDDKNAQTSPTTTITISKIEGPVAKRADSKPRSKLPMPIQFPLVAILSLAISELGYSLSWPLTQGVFTAHARLLGTWAEVGAVTGWRLCVPPISCSVLAWVDCQPDRRLRNF